jgi:hypothetical protein
MKKRMITIEQLRNADACSEQVELFRELFGERTYVTEAKAQRFATKFNFEWAKKLLTAQAWEAYSKATAPARKAYIKAIAPAREAYIKAIAQEQDAYEKAIAQAWARAYINDVPARG